MADRTRLVSVAVLCALVYVGGPSVAFGQEPGPIRIGLGVGVGSALGRCDDCGEGREKGGSGYFSVAGALSDRVLIGVETNAWTKTYQDPTFGTKATAKLYSITGAVTAYASRQFFVKGGLGASFVDFDADLGGIKVSPDVGKGLGVLVGAGYDIRLGRRVSLTPAVNYWYGGKRDLAVQGETLLSNWSHNVTDVTVGVTIR